jgi:hypothetical protein
MALRSEVGGIPSITILLYFLFFLSCFPSLYFLNQTRHEVKVEGRVMTDPRSCAKMTQMRGKSSTKELEAIPDDFLWMTWPTINGFVFSSKQVLRGRRN